MHVTPDIMDKTAGRQLVARFLATVMPSRRAQIVDRMTGVSVRGAD
jgi:hypothetical protein